MKKPRRLPLPSIMGRKNVGLVVVNVATLPSGSDAENKKRTGFGPHLDDERAASVAAAKHHVPQKILGWSWSTLRPCHRGATPRKTKSGQVLVRTQTMKEPCRLRLPSIMYRKNVGLVVVNRGDPTIGGATPE